MKRQAEGIAMLLALLVLPLGGASDTLDDLPDPTQPAYTSSSAPTRIAPRVRPATLNLQSTLVSAGRRVAVINGVTLAVGARIRDARVVSISPSTVVVSRNGRIETLRLVPSEIVAPRREVSRADVH